MFKRLCLTVTAATLAFSPLVMSNPGFAQDLELQLGKDLRIVRPDDRGPPPRRDRDDDRRAGRGQCDPDDAEDLARDAGLRRAHVVRVTPRRIVVEGMTRRGPDRMTFANERGCPEI